MGEHDGGAIGVGDGDDAGAGGGAASAVDAVGLRMRTTRAETLQAGHMLHSGYLDKKHYYLSGLLDGCCAGCSFTWKRRYFVVKGGYLFRFGKAGAAKPKGTPIPLDGATIGAAPDDEGDETCLEVSTVRKSCILRAPSVEERDEWIRLLRVAKRQAIKVSMGHVHLADDERTAADLGAEMVQAQLRREAEETRKQSMEIASLLRSSGGAFGGGNAMS